MVYSCIPLWIDFKLYFYVSNHKISWCYKSFDYVVNWFQIVFLREQSQVNQSIAESLSVVNWFQIVFLREQSQETKKRSINSNCCELISNCIFTWAITSASHLLNFFCLLWIDFKLYFYVSNHKQKRMNRYFQIVVNWFQIVFLREQSQVKTYATFE